MIAVGLAGPQLREDRTVTPFYTIGHGTRPLHDFIELLKSVAVTLVVDVRTVPRSRTNPQYNRDALPKSLEPSEIGYEHIASLGGLRGRATARYRSNSTRSGKATVFTTMPTTP